MGKFSIVVVVCEVCGNHSPVRYLKNNGSAMLFEMPNGCERCNGRCYSCTRFAPEGYLYVGSGGLEEK